MSIIDILALITQSASIFIAVQRRYFVQPHIGFSDATAPGNNSYQRTDYLNGVFNRPVGDKLVRPLFFAALSLRDFGHNWGVLLPNICQLIPSAVLLAKNKRLANKRLFIVFNYRTSAWRATPQQHRYS